MASLDVAIRTLTRGLASRSVRKHLGAVSGLEHLPAAGPLVIVANHRSYYDHLVLSLVLGFVRAAPTWFLTKSEAFEKPLSRAFHQAWRAVPVARNQADVSALKRAMDILRRGETLVVYPEGTRGSGCGLLPFKAGAFMIGLLSGAPVVPVGMVGTNTVLPKGRWRTRPGEVSVQIGAPLSVPPRGKEPARLRAMSEEAARAIEKLVESAGSVRLSDPRPPPFDVPGTINSRLTSSLDAQGKLPKDDLFLLKEMTRCARRDMHDDTEMLVVQTRLDGLRAEHENLAMRAVLALRIRRNCLRILAREPEHAMANYIMGRWHLKAPAVLGADKLRALDYLRTAVKNAAPGDTRPRSALAEAWLANGLPSNARREMERVIVETPKDHPRHAIRVQRAQKVLAELSVAEQRELSQGELSQ